MIISNFLISFNNRRMQSPTTDFQRSHTVKIVPRRVFYEAGNLVLTIQNEVTLCVHDCQN